MNKFIDLADKLWREPKDGEIWFTGYETIYIMEHFKPGDYMVYSLNEKIVFFWECMLDTLEGIQNKNFKLLHKVGSPEALAVEKEIYSK